MRQTCYSVKISTHDKGIPLKYLRISVRDCMICPKNSKTFKQENRKSTVFQGFQGLEKAVVNFNFLSTSRTCMNPVKSEVTPFSIFR